MSLGPEISHLIQTSNPVVLFDTARPGGENQSSLLFIDPIQVLQIHRISELPSLLTEMENLARSGYFLAGYFTYECGYFIEKLGLLDYVSTRPLAWFGVYRQPLEINNLALPIGDETCLLQDLNFNLDERTYHSYIERIHEHILAGDIYQVNFTGRYHLRFTGSPSALYAQLRGVQPTAYSAYLRIGDMHILSLSPELFFRVDGSQVTARPMKGTAPRGHTPAEDKQQASWLAQDVKNRAENVMITDLLRNDLGRICQIGSITVPDLFNIEQHQTLFQMTSTVTGTLKENTGLPELFSSLFPCGSVTGAPKVKAMEIIHQLETSPRGIYTGAIGYITPGEPLERKTIFNVAIRTLTLENGYGEMGIGSGIVSDSRPAEEYAECLTKARFLTALPIISPKLVISQGETGEQIVGLSDQQNREQTAALHSDETTSQESNHGSLSLPEFALLETLLWNGSYPYLERHIARMAASAHHFRYPFNANLAHAYLNEQCAGLDAETCYKVRLTLDRQGNFTCTHSILPVQVPDELFVGISRTPTDSRFVLYYHKTTSRPLYQNATTFAQQHGLADVLFFNEREELTEGAISNLFIKRDGWLLTPPIKCGLLNGVYRQHLLATNSQTRETILTLPDLLTAEQVYICNAVRGLRPVTVRAWPHFTG